MDKLKDNEDYFKGINEEKEFDEFEKELDSNSKDLNLDKKDENNFVKFDAYFYFKINEENEFIFPIQSDLFNIDEQYVHELIKNTVKKINEKNIIINYDNNKYIISLKDCEENKEGNNKDFYIKNYEFKPCNKNNFFPDVESENFPSDILLKNIDSKKINFMVKSPLNIMIREKMDTNKEEGDNKYQKYFDED